MRYVIKNEGWQTKNTVNRITESVVLFPVQKL